MNRTFVVKQEYKTRVIQLLPPDTTVRLIKIHDRAQTEYCQSCGREGGIKMHTGRVTLCTECADGANIVRQFGGEIVQEGMSFKEFRAKLDEMMGLNLL